MKFANNLTLAILMSSAAILTSNVMAQDTICGTTDEELKLCWDIASDDSNVCLFRKVTAIPYEPTASEQKKKTYKRDRKDPRKKTSSKAKAAFKEDMGYWNAYSAEIGTDPTLALDGEKYVCYPKGDADA